MPSYSAVNGYKSMWMLVLFDIPVKTPDDQEKANTFRKRLLKDGFSMMQYSVYIRFCSSAETRDVHKKRVDSFVPLNGKVSIIEITDKQYGKISNYIGRRKVKMRDAPKQLEMF